MGSISPAASRALRVRLALSVFILAVTLAVSAAWEKMVYTIPVLVVLLFAASGLPSLRSETGRRNVEEDSASESVGGTGGLDG